jgi:drug/metabolite transporter (DMT)-like permease
VVTGITPAVAAAVLFAAVLHAGWNALAKFIPDRLAAAALIGAISAVFGIVCVTFAPFPAGASWPFLVGSAITQTGYLLLLTAAYARGEFGRVYPVARGTAPVAVTVVSLTVLGEQLAIGQILGIAVVVGGIAILVLARGWPRVGDGLGLAGLTGLTIAAYTVVDGLGVRRSGSSFGYASWLFLLHGPLVLFAAMLLAARRTRLAAPAAPGPGGAGSRGAAGSAVGRFGTVRWPLGWPRGSHLAAGLIGGAMSVLAYAIVLWAQDRASLALVSALRETSVLFAGILGALFFSEPFTRRQTVGAVIIVAGIALIQRA